MTSHTETSDEDFPRKTVSRLEAVMLSVAIIAAALLFIVAFEYEYPDNVFPHVLSAIVIVTGFILLVRDYVPIDSLKDEAAMDLSEELVDSDESEDLKETSKTQIHGDEVYTLLLIAGYVVTGILVGLFWVTPAFVLVYFLWQGRTWKQAIGGASLSLLIPYFLMQYLNIDLISGVMF